jgi:hypothetical protein
MLSIIYRSKSILLFHNALAPGNADEFLSCRHGIFGLGMRRISPVLIAATKQRGTKEEEGTLIGEWWQQLQWQ